MDLLCQISWIYFFCLQCVTSNLETLLALGKNSSINCENKWEKSFILWMKLKKKNFFTAEIWTFHVKSTGVIICNYINQCFMILQFAVIEVFLTFSLLNVMWANYLSFIKSFRRDPNPEEFLESWQYLSTVLLCRFKNKKTKHCRISTMYRIYS